MEDSKAFARDGAVLMERLLNQEQLVSRGRTWAAKHGARAMLSFCIATHSCRASSATTRRSVHYPSRGRPSRPRTSLFSTRSPI